MLLQILYIKHINHINGFYPSEIEHGTSWSPKLHRFQVSRELSPHGVEWIFFSQKNMVDILTNSLPLFLFDLIFSTGGLIHIFHTWHRPLDSWTPKIFRMIWQTLEIPSNSAQPCWNHLKSLDFLRQQSRNHLNFHALTLKIPMILLDVTHGIATCKAAHRNALVLAGNPIGFMGKIRKHDILFKANMTVKSIIYQKNSWAWP